MNRLKGLILPGLNLHPKQMEDLALSLNQYNFDTDIYTLPGIDPKFKNSVAPGLEINFQLWKDEVASAYAQQKYDFIIGFSLGGLIASTLAHENRIHKKTTLILLAPALRIKKYSWLPEIALRHLPLSGMLSLQNEDFIVHRFTPRDVYLSLYEGVRELPNSLEFLGRHSVFIAIHPQDELVDAKKIITEFTDLKTTNHQLFIQDFRPQMGNYLHHLCFHKRNLTSQKYQSLIAKMAQFIDSPGHTTT